MDYLNDRQRLIMEFLHQEGDLAVKEIQRKFDIPTATLYRDLQKLVDAGLASRVHGRVLVSHEQRGQPERGNERCLMCGRPAGERLAFALEMTGGDQANACCAHCGLMLLENHTGVVTAMTADYLFGAMTNVRQAYYLVESSVQPCCSPSVLAFGKRANAERFQAGFGGRLYEYTDAINEVRRMMSLHGNHPAEEK